MQVSRAQASRKTHLLVFHGREGVSGRRVGEHFNHALLALRLQRAHQLGNDFLHIFHVHNCPESS
jgi:hypothetical protein